MSFVDIGDSELIYLIRNGNEEAKDYLITRYNKRIYGIINSLVSKRYIKRLDYEDYYQDCFVVFLKCLEMFDEEYNFYNYLSSAIDKKLTKMLDKEEFNMSILSLDYSAIDKDYCLLDVIKDGDVTYKESELSEFIDNHFDIVSKQVIEYKLKGYSYLEISEILGINKKRIYKIANRIKNVLYNRL